MTTGQTQYGDCTPREAGYIAEGMLSHAIAEQVLIQFGLTKEQPKNQTDTIKFRRPIVLPAALTPLAEGVTPSSTKWAYEDVSCTLGEYGSWIEITDKIQALHTDPVVQNCTEALGEQAGRTMEMITWGVLKGGTSVAYANGTLRTSVNTPMTKELQQKIVRALKAQKARKISKILGGSTEYGSSQVEAAFVAVCHTNLEYDIRRLPGFVATAQYGQRKVLCDEELGCVDDVRYVLSSELSAWEDGGAAKSGSGTEMVSTSGTLSDVYPIIFLGKEAFATVPLRGEKAVVPMVVTPKAAAGDPLGQRGSVGWKAWFAALILNQTWMYRAEVAATYL